MAFRSLAHVVLKTSARVLGHDVVMIRGTGPEYQNHNCSYDTICKSSADGHFDDFEEMRQLRRGVADVYDQAEGLWLNPGCFGSSSNHIIVVSSDSFSSDKKFCT
jgi:hypothetical protein